MEKKTQGHLNNRMQYYAKQKKYLAQLQPLYLEMKMIFRDLGAAYEQYSQSHTEFGADELPKLDPDLMERIAFLQSRLKHIRSEISSILDELKRLEERNQE